MKYKIARQHKAPKQQSQTIQSHDLEGQESQLQAEVPPTNLAFQSQVDSSQQASQAMQQWGYAPPQSNPDADTYGS